MALPTHGTMAVDWEQRIDFDRLRRERLQRVKDWLAKSEMGSLLCFEIPGRERSPSHGQCS